MKDGPDIARIAALIGDPARANILTALMSGRALTATELAAEAGVTPQTASSHLARLRDGGLIAEAKQGRHKYLRLASPDVAQVLEALMGLAAGQGQLRTRPGPKDPELRQARVCYNHLAGDRGTQMYDSLVTRGFLRAEGEALGLTEAGAAFVEAFGIDHAALARGRSALCRPCLDWSERRSHLAGSLGRAMLQRIGEIGWARRIEGTRIVRFSPQGLRDFDATFPSTSVQIAPQVRPD
ncbi:winged helix-turn-helix domain-containing protein [Mesobacterium sp. TK19101]|uniref:Winged helix-turn-helix domain-containing protein n=1 Tax=Mesobacterium hydrothermale TaxID=3111907 RepID=A0ABU6HLZ4_9RHOB|nr:winged helix-turn-helix domain-containing protein [Mesobacterium sp. TK19101]MEC3862881.1 winged helix-turn-helix domain-containing protein [Mesobacterium sp. TK19101]